MTTRLANEIQQSSLTMFHPAYVSPMCRDVRWAQVWFQPCVSPLQGVGVEEWGINEEKKNIKKKASKAGAEILRKDTKVACPLQFTAIQCFLANKEGIFHTSWNTRETNLVNVKLIYFKNLPLHKLKCLFPWSSLYSLESTGHVTSILPLRCQCSNVLL